MLRADMDALAVTEEADVPYKSQVPGLMHGCAHDGHTAGLLLAARVLQEMRGELCGNVKLMFEPGAELDGSIRRGEKSAAPHMEGGALPMIQAGVLENPKVDAAFGCHLWGATPEGKVWVKAGPVMAAPDEFRVNIIGKGGHGGFPHKAVDPVMLAAQVITSFQTIVSRRIDPTEFGIVSICSIHGGTVHHMIPDSVQIMGTIRTFTEELREWIPRTMEEMLTGIVRSQGGDFEFEYLPHYAAMINDTEMTAVAERAIGKIVGAENVVRITEPIMRGEDFAYIAQHVPASFFFVGIAKDEPQIHHDPKFAWDDKAMRISAASLCQAAVDFLNGAT
jgi:amidohydrolase